MDQIRLDSRFRLNLFNSNHNKLYYLDQINIPFKIDLNQTINTPKVETIKHKNNYDNRSKSN